MHSSCEISFVPYRIILFMLSEDSKIFSDVQSAGAVNPLNDDFESLMGTLGLSERKPVPDPVFFDETDPLGTSLMSTSDGNLMPHVGRGKNVDTLPSLCGFIIPCWRIQCVR